MLFFNLIEVERMKWLISALLLLVFPKLLSAQDLGQTGIDSLLQQLGKMTEDTNKVNLLDKISNSYLDGDNQKLLQYANQELELANKLGWVKGQVMAFNMLGEGYSLIRENQKGLELTLKGYELARKNKLTYLQYKLLDVAGHIHFGMADYDQAIADLTSASAYFQHARSFENLSLPPSKSWESSAWLLGVAYYYQKKNSAAFRCYQRVLDKCILEKDTLGAHKALNMFINIHTYSTRDYPAVLDHAFRKLLYFKQGDTSFERAYTFIQIAYAYGLLKEYVKALEYYRLASAVVHNGNAEITSMVNNGMESMYQALGDHKNALKLALELLRTTQPGDYGSVVYMHRIAEDYIALQQYNQALLYLDKSLETNNKSGNMYPKAMLLSSLSYVYYLMKRYDQALAIIKDSMDNKKLGGYEKSLNSMYWAIIVRDAPDTVLHKWGIAPAGRYQRAAKNLQLVLNYFKDHETLSTDQLKCYKELSTTYKMMKDYKGFYYTYPLYIALRDSSVNKENQYAFLSKLADIQFEKREDSLKFQQRLTSDKLKQQTLATTQQRKYYLSGIIALLALSFFIARNYYNQRRSNRLLSVANTQITQEKQRSDNLLLNILPADIAEELKEKGSAGARLYEEVTVLFTDFVNFTTISELLTPQELVDELHTCFKAFDDIISKYGIEKIKTIGDAYLAVAGLPNADAQHASNTVNAALDIQQFIHDRKERMGNRSFDIRIGIHSGSVVAGIVGVKKFAYDIWGDTVNTAARMEQHSLPGQINLSEKTFELVKDQFAFTYRGEIEAKNKGALKMYFVEKQGASLIVK